MQHGQQVIILLAGGSKSGQQSDITQAIELVDQIRTQGLLPPPSSRKAISQGSLDDVLRPVLREKLKHA